MLFLILAGLVCVIVIIKWTAEFIYICTTDDLPYSWTKAELVDIILYLLITLNLVLFCKGV